MQGRRKGLMLPLSGLHLSDRGRILARMHALTAYYRSRHMESVRVYARARARAHTHTHTRTVSDFGRRHVPHGVLLWPALDSGPAAVFE